VYAWISQQSLVFLVFLFKRIFILISLSLAYCMSRPSHSSWLNNRNAIRCREQVHEVPGWIYDGTTLKQVPYLSLSATLNWHFRAKLVHWTGLSVNITQLYASQEPFTLRRSVIFIYIIGKCWLVIIIRGLLCTRTLIQPRKRSHFRLRCIRLYYIL
jgi:hypothetical protein